MTTVTELLYDKPEKAAPDLRKKLARLGVVVPPATLAMSPKLPERIADAIASILRMPVGDLILTAWDKHQLVRQACQRTSRSPGASESVSIFEHTLKSTHLARVDLDVGGRRQPILDVRLDVTLRIDSLVVEVRDGAVAGWGAGTASAWAELGVSPPNAPDLYALTRCEGRLVRLPAYVEVRAPRMPATVPLPPPPPPPPGFDRNRVVGV